jgi:hypothetical protein
MTIQTKKINKETELNGTTSQMNLTDIHRIFHPIAIEYVFFSEVHGTFSKQIIS